MSFIWYSILKRTDDFYEKTMKRYFKQLDSYKKLNQAKNSGESNENVEEINESMSF